MKTQREMVFGTLEIVEWSHHTNTRASLVCISIFSLFINTLLSQWKQGSTTLHEEIQIKATKRCVGSWKGANNNHKEVMFHASPRGNIVMSGASSAIMSLTNIRSLKTTPSTLFMRTFSRILIHDSTSTIALFENLQMWRSRLWYATFFIIVHQWSCHCKTHRSVLMFNFSTI